MDDGASNREARYSQAFFADFADQSARSAHHVLGELFRVYKPTRVLDIGCGIGAWLAESKMRGATQLRGLDGPWVASDQLRIPPDSFERIDFESTEWPEIRPVDLAISLEVAEHLSIKAGEKLVATLCQSAPVVLFSAAIPCQGGEGHINEQWQSWWAEKFRAHGFRPSLRLRRRMWNNGEVEFWYQQNLTLYIGPDQLDIYGDSDDPSPQLDVVHPRLHEIRVIKRERRRAKWARFLPFLKR